MKKIGLLSLYYKTYNYGAQLQAYALQKAISLMGYDCEQIQFDWSNEETKLSYETASINRDGFERFYNSIPHSSKVYTPKNIRSCVSNYDAFVCGSDQIWGVDKQMPKYVLPMMALSFVPESKVKIAYAASMGALCCSTEKQEILKATLKRLNAISVREKGATNFIETLSCKPVEYVLDPTLLLSAKEWDDIAENPQTSEPYVLLYGLGNGLKGNEFIKRILQTQNIKTIELAYDSGEKYSPYEFLGLIKNAQYILTNSYHATIFSIIYNKPFYSFPVDAVDGEYSKNNRMLELLQQLGLQSRYIDWDIDNDEKDIYSIDYQTANKALECLKEKSLNFLQTNLSKENNTDRFLPEYENCCLCAACVSACGQGAITFEKNTYGLQYIHINNEKCINCGLCKAACPVINKKQLTPSDYPIKAFSAVFKDEIICKKSSSGGAFFAIASKFILNGGIVFGARYDDTFKVIHSHCDNLEQLYEFMGSKYVRSDIGNSYKEVEYFLQNGRKVLFSGTPCQIYALRAFLKKDYDNLFTIDLICHGTPVPELFEKYISFINKDNTLKRISMRGKDLGAVNINSREPLSFVNTCVKHHYISNRQVISTKDDMFFSLFSSNSYLTPACYNCAFKDIERISDITLGDFHGIAAVGKGPIIKYKNGVSVILLQSKKGAQLLSICQSELELEEYPVGDAVLHNPMMCKNSERPPAYDYMNAIFTSSSIEKLYYTNELLKEYEFRQREFRNLEKTKNLTAVKTRLLSASSQDFLQKVGSSEFLVYGLGEIGEYLYSRFPQNILAFLDRGTNLALFYDVPVFRAETFLKSELFKKASTTPIVIAVCNGAQQVKSELEQLFPERDIFIIADII